MRNEARAPAGARSRCSCFGEDLKRRPVMLRQAFVEPFEHLVDALLVLEVLSGLRTQLRVLLADLVAGRDERQATGELLVEGDLAG